MHAMLNLNYYSISAHPNYLCRSHWHNYDSDE